ncbi:MAG: hypothetical protein KDA24_08295 [Deltaproteobacteria bacterium]|nr:hypothetical protein [Deltaproteobacteria bacterium]
MLNKVLRSRLLGLLVSVTGALLLAAGAFLWVRPLAGPPDGAALDDFEPKATLAVTAGDEAVTSPPIPVNARALHRVVVEGSLAFDTARATLDGDMLVTGAGEGMPRLVLGAGSSALLGVAQPGRWVFALPDGIKDGGHLAVWLDLAPAARHYSMSPEDVEKALSGDLKVELWTRTAPARGPIAAAPLWFPGGMLLALGIALSVVAGRIRTMEQEAASRQPPVGAAPRDV